jgi:UbiD family decarboxylase
MNAPATNIGVDLAARARAVSSLREFLELLEEQGQLIHWRDRVLPEPDIRKVAVAAGRDVNGAPAIVFDNIAGYPGKKTVVGVHGSWNNMATLFGMPRGTTIREMFFELAGRWGRTGAQITHVPPGEASVHQCRIEQDINLYDLLPVYRINEYDGGFYLAKASVASRDPLDPDNFGKQNVGIYRLQLQGPDTFTLMTVPAHDMGRQILAAEKANKPFKIAVMLGNHPGLAVFAATPVGYDESEYEYASAMMGAPIRLTKSADGIDILADSEIVLEAELQLGERVVEGPFGEFPGSYSGVRRAPVFKVTGVSHRRDPIFENIYIGRGWTEHDTLIGLNTSAPIYAQLRESFPEVAGVNALYQHGMTAIIAVKNRMAGFAKTVALRALGTPHGVMYLKNLIMVDATVDPFDLNQVMWALSTRTRHDDIMVLPNMAMIPIDPSAVTPGKGHHLIIDATSFMAPDPVGEAHLVEPPSGPEIEALGKRILAMQNGESA